MATEYPFTKQTFVGAIRKKTGNAYAELDDDKLFSAVTNKFPNYLEQIDPVSLAPPAPVEKPSLMGRLFEAAKGVFGGGTEEPAPLAPLAVPKAAAIEPVVPAMDPGEVARLASTITDTQENVRKVLVDQTLKAREVAMDAGGVAEWLKARKANRKFEGVTRIDPVAALEAGAAQADPAAGVVRNGVAGEVTGREIAPPTGLDRFSSELRTASNVIPDKNASVLSMPDERPAESYSAEERAKAYAGNTDLLSVLTRPILGALGRSVIGKTTGNMANFAQLAANPEKYYSVTGGRSDATPVEVKRQALDAGLLDDPNPVAKFAGQTLTGFVLGGDAALAATPNIGFPLLAGAHQILDNVSRLQKGEAAQWDPRQIGVEAAKGMMFSVLPLPKTLTKAEGGILERAAREMGQVGYLTAAFTAADIAAEQKQPSQDDVLGTFALLGALHLPKISHAIWAGRIEDRLKSGGMDKDEAAKYANAAMSGDPQAQAFVDKFADDASFREAFSSQQRLRSEIKTREEGVKRNQADLIARAKAGDKTAFEELLQARVGGNVEQPVKPHVAEARRNEGLLPAKPGEVRLPAGVEADLRRTAALKKLRDMTPGEVLPPVKVPGESGEFTDPYDVGLLTYLSKAIPARMVARMPGEMRLRLGNNPEELQALSAEVLAGGKTTSPAPLAPLAAPVVKTPGVPPPVTVTPPVVAPVPAPPVVAPVVAARPVPVAPVPGGGNAFRVKSPLRRDVVASGRFDVIELDQLFNGPQDRNRTRAASNAQTEQVYQNFDEEELGHSVTSDRGAPIVMADGRILAGHGRRNVLTRVYGVGDAKRDRYRGFVEAQAAAMGLGDKVRGMREPVLVRVADKIDNATPEQFAELSNQKQMLGYSDAEKAVKDARRLLSTNMIQSLNVTDPDNILAAGNREFIASFLDKQDDKAEYLTAEGQAAPALEGRIQRAVLSALVLGDAKAGGESNAAHTVAILVEKAADYGITPMLKGLTASAPRLLKIRASKPEWDLTANLARVMPEIVRAKEAVQSGKFQTIEKYFRQSDWTRRASPEELEIATLLLNAKSAKQVSELLDAYTKTADNHDSKTMDMFGGVLPESTKLDVLRRLNNGQSWTTINVEPDRADNGVGGGGSVRGEESQSVGAAPGASGSGGAVDGGPGKGEIRPAQSGGAPSGGGRYQDVIQNDLDDLNKLFGTGENDARQSDNFGLRPESRGEIPVPTDGGNHDRAAGWDGTLRTVQGVYEGRYGSGGRATAAAKSRWRGLEVDQRFGASPAFAVAEKFVLEHAPAGTQVIPIKNLWSVGIALPQQGVILIDASAPVPVRTAAHETFHLLTKAPESAPLARRVVEAVDVTTPAVKAYVAGRNAWRELNGQEPLESRFVAEEVAAELFADWETKSGFDGTTYRLNSAIPERSRGDVEQALEMLHSPRELPSAPEWGEPAENDLFGDPGGPSRIQWELERIAESRGVKPAGWGDYDALATRALQTKASRLADQVKNGEMTSEAAKQAWDKAQADIARGRSKIERRKDSLRADAFEKAQGKLLDVPSSSGMLFEEGAPYDAKTDSTALVKRQGLVGEEAATRVEVLAKQLDFVSSLTGVPSYDSGSSSKAARPVSNRAGVDDTSILANRQAIREALTSWNPQKLKDLFDRGVPVSTVIPELMRSKTDIPEWNVRGFTVRTPADSAALFIGLRSPAFEQFSVLFLDSRQTVIEGRIISIGVLDSSLVHPRDVFGDVPDGTVSVVCGHNHPSEEVSPSKEDVQLTRQLVQAGRLARIPLLDSIITQGHFLSLRESCLVEFDDGGYSEWKPRVVPRKEFRGSAGVVHPFVRMEGEAPWNVLPREGLPTINMPFQMADLAKAFKAGGPGFVHIVGLNTRKKVQYIWRLPKTDSPNDIVKVVARQSGRFGVAAIVVDTPDAPTAQELKMFNQLLDATKVLGVKMLDVAHWTPEGTYNSLRESGVMQFEEAKPGYGGVKDERDLPEWFDTVPGIMRRDGSVDFGIRGKTHEESFGMNLWGHRFHYSPKDGKVVWWEKQDSDISNSVRDAIENRGWKYDGDTEFLKWKPLKSDYMESDRFDADPLEKVARVLVGMNDGKVPTRAQAEEFLKARGWADKLAGKLDEIQKKAESIAGTKELDYAVGIKTGKLGSEGEAGRQSGGGSERGDAGSGSALAGTTGGTSPRRRTDIRIAGAEGLPRPPNYVPAAADADEDQRLGINLMLHRFANGGRGFLLADGTGMGKTTQILLTADLFAKQNPGARVLIVTKNAQVIKGSFYSDSKRMGVNVNQFDLTTYDGLKSGVAVRNLRMEKGKVVSNRTEIDKTGRYDLVIFDEAHELKNLTSAKTTVASEYIGKAKHVVFATATPMDRPTGSVYFLSQVTGIAPDRIGGMLGFEWKQVRDPDTGEVKNMIAKRAGVSWADVLKNLANMRNEAVKQGAMIRREYPLMAKLSSEEVKVSPSDLDFDQRIVSYYQGLSAHYPPNSIAAKNFKGQATNASHHFGESLKIKKAIEKALESITEGRRPIVVVSKVDTSERLKAPPMMVENAKGQTVPNWKYAVWAKTIGREYTIPAVAKGIVAELKAKGVIVAEIFGAGDKAAEVARFQNGHAGAVVMTAASGGAGINLDDVVGDAPRDLIVITPIFAGDMFQQVLGRISRRNTASTGRVIFLNASGTYGDSRAQAIQKAKIELMTRIQEGADIDIAGFDKEAGLPMAGGSQEEFGGDEDGGALADMASPGKGRSRRVSRELAQGEDLGGTVGGVWEPRAIPGGMVEPTTGRAVMTMPSLVRLYKEMTGNRAPAVQKRIRIMGGHALGAFYPGAGQIKLLASIFDPVSDARKGELLKQARDEVQNPNSSEEVNRYRELLEQEYAKPESQEPRQALATLAHEIGHAYDWLPDRSMAKGNILGRIAALNQYMNDMLGQLPQFQDLITQEERKEFRAEAAKQARAQIPPVPGANEAQRKARDASVNKLTAEIYGRMLAKEAKARNLVTKEQITEELKALTQWWKPFDEDLDPHFTEYRYSAKELLADSLSVMMNRPEALRRIAPLFDKALFGWMGNRPEFQRVWDEIQAELIGGEADKRLVQDILEGFREAEGRERDNLKARQTGWNEIVTALRFGFIDTADPILRKIREYGERELDAMDNPRYAIEDAIYVGSAHEAYLKLLGRDVLEPLSRAGLTTDMLGLYALAKRVKNERGALANPFGVDPAAAERILAGFGPEASAVMDKAWEAFWTLRKAHVLDDVEASGSWSTELMEKAGDNIAYATFDLVDYMKARYGSAVGPRVYRQVGTLAAIKNPFVATVQKDLSLISATLRNVARKSVIDFMKKAYPGEIAVAKTRWNGRFQEAVEPDDPHQELLGYVDGGKFNGYYVDKWVAAHFAHEDPHWLRTLGRVLGATMRPFRFAFTDANPGFWAMNLFRDYHGAVAHLPGLSSPVGSYTWHWAKGVREGFKSVFGTPGPVVQEMLKHKMLISMVSRSQEATEEDTILDRLLVQVQPKKVEWSNLSHPAEMISAALDWWTGIGKSFERSNQIAAYTWLKKNHPTMTDQEIAHLVRTVASPAFLRKGALYPIYNNLLMFSNANKEGLRAEAEAFRRGKAAWGIKTAAYVVLPRMIVWAIKWGLFAAAVAKVREWFSPDDDKTEKMPGEVSLQEMYGLIPEYDLANYLCAPVGMTDGGKVVYLRLPQQENARMIGGIFWKTLKSLGDGELKDVFADTFSFAGGQVPRANPAIGLLADIGKLLGGQNPTDTFRQQPMIDQTTWEAQDARTAQAAAKGLWNEAGGGIIIRFRSEDSRSIQTTLEKALGAPFLGNVASRFVKVSDRGLWEDVAKIKEASKRDNARERLNVAEMVQGERPFGMDAAAHKDYLKKLLIQKGLREAKSDSTRADPEMIRNLQILRDAGGNEEKGKLVEMLNRRGYLKSGKNP